MTPEQIKNLWNQVSDDNADQLSVFNDLLEAREKRNSLEKISSMYLVLSSVAFSCCIIFGFSAIACSRLVVGSIAGYALCMFMLVASVCDFYLFLKIRKINIFTMGVATVANAARSVRRLHFLFQAVMILLAIPVLILLFSGLADKGGEYVRSGIIGGICGFIIGTILFIRLMKNYNRVMRND